MYSSFYSLKKISVIRFLKNKKDSIVRKEENDVKLIIFMHDFQHK